MRIQTSGDEIVGRHTVPEDLILVKKPAMFAVVVVGRSWGFKAAAARKPGQPSWGTR